MPSQLPLYMIHRLLTICWTPPDEGQEFYADSAYTGEGTKEIYVKKKVAARVNEKGYKNRPLTDTQKKIQPREIQGEGKGGAYIRICGKQYERFLHQNHRDGKSQGKNRHDEHCV